jgi:hypothetical protein
MGGISTWLENQPKSVIMRLTAMKKMAAAMRTQAVILPVTLTRRKAQKAANNWSTTEVMGSR